MTFDQSSNFPAAVTQGYWNGLPTTIRLVTGIVPPHDPENDPPLAWWKELSGQRVEAVEVQLDGVNHGGGVCYLDNRDGHGYLKVTEGRGSPRWGHKNLPPLLDMQPSHTSKEGTMSEIGSEAWLRERFPDKNWHRHPRTDGRTDFCDGTPSDCADRPRTDRDHNPLHPGAGEVD